MQISPCPHNPEDLHGRAVTVSQPEALGWQETLCTACGAVLATTDRRATEAYAKEEGRPVDLHEGMPIVREVKRA